MYVYYYYTKYELHDFQLVLVNLRRFVRVVKLVQGECARKYEYKKKESSTERKDERINNQYCHLNIYKREDMALYIHVAGMGPMSNMNSYFSLYVCEFQHQRH